MSGSRNGFTSFASSVFFFVFFFLLLLRLSLCSKQTTSIATGFKATQVDFIDNDGLILHSNNSQFYFGFQPLGSSNTTAFLLVVIHKPTNRVVWSANRGSPVSSSDVFVFGEDGNVKLYSGSGVVWSTNTAGSGGTSIEILDWGNLVLVGSGGGKGNPNLLSFVWQSFDYPTDTLLLGQSFSEGMNLTGVADKRGLTHSLRVSSGDMILQANFRSPQVYWSISKDRRNMNNVGSLAGKIFMAKIETNSWNLYDRENSLLSRFLISSSDAEARQWAAVLSGDGSITFHDLTKTAGSESDQGKMLIGVCDTPQPCGMYSICSSGSSKFHCRCPSLLKSQPDCVPEVVSFCGGRNSDGGQLTEVTDNVKYFATDFVPPTARNSNLSTCKNMCESNCSCVVLFFEQSSGDCFLFDQIGSLQQSNTKNFSFFIKIANAGRIESKIKKIAVIVAVTVLMVAVFISLLVALVALRNYRRRRTTEPGSSKCLFSSDEDDFFDTNITGAPVRYTYSDLQVATNDFSVKLGAGGFGSVYQGKLPDGTNIAVKKLEGIGQGKKEFRAEVSTIGSIHHLHLVQLRGFCSEGTHRLLAYDFMANGSLDRWIFQKKPGGGGGEGKEAPLLDWDTRVKIAVGTAKALAYLHEDCESKIVHCDIKPENVLLDGSFEAKVSDFGLAKMMTREQSHVFTTLRGTRGYLAPEWIINSAISEKSDVYSYGMVLLEIIGGRKNFDPSQTSDMVHFPSYASKMMEEGKFEEVVDRRLKDSGEFVKGGSVERAIKVALWCIQEDMNLRPSMTRVVQMLEGIGDVLEPPASSHLGFRLGSNLLKTGGSEEDRLSSGEGKSCSGLNSDAFLSDVRLSGPR